MRMRRNWKGEQALHDMDTVLKADPTCMSDAVGMDWERVFERKAPLRVEIGSGKGDFIITLADREPGINFIGIEKNLSILYIAARKNLDKPARNLRFLPIDAGFISAYFASKSVDRFYLNFSDPWPKNSHASRRLTAGHRLREYSDLLAPGGRICFKTDQEGFFEFSLKAFITEGWSVEKISHDLLASGIRDNIMTEYEKRFAGMGLPIYYFEAINKEESVSS